MNLKAWLFAMLLILFLTINLFAEERERESISIDIRQTLEQSVGEIVRIRTVGRGEFQGILLTTSPERIEVQNSEGLVLEIVISEITEVIVIDPEKEADVYYQDAAANKLILMPIGFGMDPGELHIADQEIIMVSVSYGISESFSLWGAVSVPGLLLNARYSFQPHEKVGISLGSFAGLVFFEPIFIALPYGIASFGTVNQNFTIGLGGIGIYGWEKDEANSNFFLTGGVCALGGKIIIAQTASIITENWVILGKQYDIAGDLWSTLWGGFFPTVVFRIAGSRFSWDIGVTMPFMLLWDDELSSYTIDWIFNEPIPIPILSFTYRIR
jgi:hypothetical protein